MKKRTDTFSFVINSYLGSPKFESLAPNSRASYRRYLARAERTDLGSLPADQIRPRLIQAFLDGMADKPGAQQNAYVALKALEWWAAGPRELAPAFMMGIEVAGSNGGHKPWTDAQVALAELHARPDIARAITLAANTGQRASDLVRMAWTDIEEHQGRLGINVTQKKTGLQLWIPFTHHLSAAMAKWERRPAPILLKRDGTKWSRSDISMAWKYERDHRPELAPCRDVVLHGLRATACIRLRRLGATEAEISAMIGLSIPMVTRYCRFSDQQKNAMAAVHYLDGTNGERTENGSVRLKAAD